MQVISIPLYHVAVVLVMGEPYNVKAIEVMWELDKDVVLIKMLWVVMQVLNLSSRCENQAFILSLATNGHTGKCC